MLNLQRILVPIDFSESAVLANEQARLIAERFGAELHVLHVTQHPTVSEGGSFVSHGRSATDTATVHVHVDGAENDEGRVVAALYASEDSRAI